MRNLLDIYRSKPTNSYNFYSDSDNEFRWHQIAREYVNKFPLILEKIVYINDLYKISEKIVEHFKVLIEQKDLYLKLYNDHNDNPVREKLAQLILWEVIEKYILHSHLEQIKINYEAKKGMIILSNNYLESLILLKYSSSQKIGESFDELEDQISQNSSKKGIFLLVAVNDNYNNNYYKLLEKSESLKTNGNNAPQVKLIDGRIRLRGYTKVAYDDYFK